MCIICRCLPMSEGQAAVQKGEAGCQGCEGMSQRFLVPVWIICPCGFTVGRRATGLLSDLSGTHSTSISQDYCRQISIANKFITDQLRIADESLVTPWRTTNNSSYWCLHATQGCSLKQCMDSLLLSPRITVLLHREHVRASRMPS